MPFAKRIPTTLAAILLSASLMFSPSVSNAGGVPAESPDSALRSAPRAAAGRCFATLYQGSLQLYGHYARPGDSHRFGSIQRFMANSRGAIRLDWTTWGDGDTSRVPETFLLANGVVYHREAPNASWETLQGEPEAIARMHLLAGYPWEFLRDPRAHPSDSLEVAPGSGLPAVLVRTHAHPRLGDVRDEVRFDFATDKRLPAGVRDSLPALLSLRMYERDQDWWLLSRLVSHRDAADSESLLAPPGVPRPTPAESDRLERIPDPRRVADGIWSLDMEDLDSRSLVAEFEDHVAVIEAAVSSANGERIVDAVKRKWPHKPIRYFLFSHHHPHYTGGLRAFIAEQALIVTTRGNQEFIGQVHRYPFTLVPDRQARVDEPLRQDTFTGRYELQDRTNHLIALDIGARSDHTDEFVVFWFPRQRLVFETEQGWVTVDGKLRASRRAEKFMKTLAEEGIEPDRLIQSWPMRGNRAELTRAELDSLILARKP
jgi:hypothetical protein